MTKPHESVNNQEQAARRERIRRLAPACFLATLAVPVAGIVYLAFVTTMQLMYATRVAADSDQSVPEVIESLPQLEVLGGFTLQQVSGLLFWGFAAGWGGFYGARQAAAEWRPIATWVAAFYSFVAIAVIVVTGSFSLLNLLRLATIAPAAYCGALFAAALKGKIAMHRRRPRIG